MTTTHDKLPFFPLGTFPFSVIIDIPYASECHNERNYSQETPQRYDSTKETKSINILTKISSILFPKLKLLLLLLYAVEFGLFQYPGLTQTPAIFLPS